jgi:MFS family permease
MTGFGLGVWVFQTTGSATRFALILLCNMLPRALVAPIAGPLADRYDRRRLMIGADLGAGATTVLVALLLAAGRLEPGHVYALTALSSAFGALQRPASEAAVSQLVPRDRLGRANGMVQLGHGAAQVLAPALAGALYAGFGLAGAFLVDVASFLAAVLTLGVVRFPVLPTAEGETAPRVAGLGHRLSRGLLYLRSRPGLLGLVLLFAAVNFLVGMAEAVLTPMVLRFTSAEGLGTVMTIGGAGMLLGSVLMSLWGGGERKVFALFGAYAAVGIGVLVAGLAPSVVVVSAGAFVAFVFLPIVMGANQAVMQSKVAPEVQGRVFALRMATDTLAFAGAYLAAGPLAALHAGRGDTRSGVCGQGPRRGGGRDQIGLRRPGPRSRRSLRRRRGRPRRAAPSAGSGPRTSVPRSCAKPTWRSAAAASISSSGSRSSSGAGQTASTRPT